MVIEQLPAVREGSDLCPRAGVLRHAMDLEARGQRRFTHALFLDDSARGPFSEGGQSHAETWTSAVVGTGLAR